MISSFTEKTLDFLEYFGESSMTDKAFRRIVKAGNGERKFLRLLKAAGHDNNPGAFFSELVSKLEKAESYASKPIKINNITLPHLLIVSLLEKLIPKNHLISVKDVPQLEKLTNSVIPEKNRADMQKIIEMYPVRLSMHTIRQMRVSKAVARQYLPFPEESDLTGQADTWTGHFHRGILEQMYQNRAVLLLNMSCPVYCRFCFRKHKASRNQPRPTPEDVKEATEYIRQSPSIKEVLLTGGDPFLNRETLLYAIDRLKDVSHVQTLRIGTRSVSYYPDLFYADNAAWLKTLKMKGSELRQKGRRMEIGTHFIHPDEVSPESLDIISDLVKHGITVYVQTPFLKGCNEEGADLTKLFSLLRGAGAEIHYLFVPCEPVRGTSAYWTSVSKGLDAANYLRANLSDRAFPKVCASTPIGKIDWHVSGWAVEKDKKNEGSIWVRTPYTPDYFKAFAPAISDSHIIRVNAEGTIDVSCMATMGDDTLFSSLASSTARSGSHGRSGLANPDHPASTTARSGLTNPDHPASTPARSGLANPDYPASTPARSGLTNPDHSPYLTTPQELRELQTIALRDQRIPQSVVNTGSSTLFRIHKTQAELDAEANTDDIEYIKKHEDITDVIISSKKDVIESLYRIGDIIKTLQKIRHLNAVRLRSLDFNYSPEKYSHTAIDNLGNLNRLTIVNPLRLEIETQFLHSDEFRPAHANLVNALHEKGITVYNNTPLLSQINDTPDEINNIAYQCRKIGIEFHHLYLAGLPLQKRWNKNRPIDINDVIDIGSRLRRNGSGREIPRYIIRTELGEADFGLTSRIFQDNGQIWVKLLPYNFEYYKNMRPDFSCPTGVKADADDKPVVSVAGLKIGVSRDYFLFCRDK